MDPLSTNMGALRQMEVVESVDQLRKENSLIHMTIFEGYDKMS